MRPCSCPTPLRARDTGRPRIVPGVFTQRRDGRLEPRVARGRGRLRESGETHRPPESEPVVIAGTKKRTQCRPFLTVQKDAEKFAACNALADEIGPIDTPEKAFRILEDAIGDEVNEVFGLMTLDLHLRFKSMGETGRGEPSSVMAPLGPTLQTALIDGAYAVIIFHVHPSGIEAEPSEADKETTKSFVDAFEIVDLYLLDHIIVGGDIRRRSYYSFAEDNAL
jgi:DNA repair protein RadC